MNSIQPIIAALEAAHGHFNEMLFGSSLREVPTITLMSKGKKNALGWYGRDRWQNGESTPAELNLSAEDLKRPAEQVLETLIHEMCHQKAHQDNIKDCSRSGAYHNKRFKDIAETAGLVCKEPDKKVGYGFTSLGPTALQEVESIRSTIEPLLVIARRVIPKPAKKGKMMLFVCACGFKIRSGRKDLSARCNLCESDFILQGGNEDEN